MWIYVVANSCGGLRAAFKLALRQAEGLMLSVVDLLGCELAAPDHPTVSRRAARLESITRGPLHVLIDSTGLKVYGAGQWQVGKHGRSKRKWRKLHLDVDARSGQIVAAALMDHDVSLSPPCASTRHRAPGSAGGCFIRLAAESNRWMGVTAPMSACSASSPA